MPSQRKTVIYCLLAISVAGTLVSVTLLWNRMTRKSERRVQIEELEARLSKLRKEFDSIKHAVDQRAERK